MEPRNRLIPGAPVRITVLESPAEAFSGTVIECGGATLIVDLGASVPTGAAVKIEGRDVLLLGEICGCRAEREGHRAQVRILHSLGALAELERLNRALLGEDSAPPRQRPGMLHRIERK